MIQFQNCKVIGDGIGYDTYAKQEFKRGDARFIMSRGELMTFADCPAKWIAGVERGDTKATDWGDLIDSMVLSPAKFDAKFAVAPLEYKPGKPWTYKADACVEWRKGKEAAGLKVTTEADMKKATTALIGLKKNRDIMELVECSKTQVMATSVFHDKETGLDIPLRVLLDLVPDKTNARWGKSLGDFKTARNAAMFAFGRQINESHYDAQCGLYRPVYVGATGEDRVDWQLAIQENEAPYHSEIYTLSEKFIENGEAKILKSLALYCWCLKNNQWPGYSMTARIRYNGVAIIEPEDWMITRLAEFCPIPQNGAESNSQSTDDITP
jgi:hypothetical protein